MPPSLRPRWSRPSSNELRMSLPITATGPLNVLMKPILMVFCWAAAGPAASNNAALAAKRVLRIVFLPEAVSARVLDGLMYRKSRALVHPEKMRSDVPPASHGMRLVPVDREAGGLAV